MEAKGPAKFGVDGDNIFYYKIMKDYFSLVNYHYDATVGNPYIWDSKLLIFRKK